MFWVNQGCFSPRLKTCLITLGRSPMPSDASTQAPVPLEKQISFLQTLLLQDNIPALLKRVHERLQDFVAFQGISFTGMDNRIQVHEGMLSTHQIRYPLLIQKQPLGHVILSRDTPFTEGERQRLRILLHHLCFAINPILKYQEALDNARTCPLTRIPNRRAFQEELSRAVTQAVRNQNHFSLLVLDIDDFKKVNDTHGHDVGDVILTEFTARLVHLCRHADRLFRIGGEEFAFLLMDTDEEHGQYLADRIQQACLDHPIASPAGLLSITVSMGLCAWRVGTDEHTLFKKADQAMYLAKKSGKNCSKRSQDLQPTTRITTKST